MLTVEETERRDRQVRHQRTDGRTDGSGEEEEEEGKTVAGSDRFILMSKTTHTHTLFPRVPCCCIFGLNTNPPWKQTKLKPWMFSPVRYDSKLTFLPNLAPSATLLEHQIPSSGKLQPRSTDQAPVTTAEIQAPAAPSADVWFVHECDRLSHLLSIRLREIKKKNTHYTSDRWY